MRVIGIGAGGHAKVVIEILRLVGNYELIGLLDPRPDLLNTRVLGVSVLGHDSLLPEIYASGIRHAFIGAGTVGDARLRRTLYQKARAEGFEIVSALHPAAYVSDSAVIGDGPTVMAGAVINAAACVGDNVIVNSGAVVEHDCILRNHVHIAPGACLSGGVRVGDSSHIGVGAVVLQGIEIGENSIVGAGAVVIDNVPDHVVVVGIPARIQKEVKS